jgi:hypothetical protein
MSPFKGLTLNIKIQITWQIDLMLLQKQINDVFNIDITFATNQSAPNMCAVYNNNIVTCSIFTTNYHTQICILSFLHVSE